MSEHHRRRVRKEQVEEPKERIHIRVKKPRQLDENGNPLPHRHTHTHGGTTTNADDTRYTYREISVVPMESQDLTQIDNSTTTNDRSFVTPSVSRMSGISQSTGRPHRSHRKHPTPEQLKVFDELEPDFKETRIKTSRFIKHESANEFDPYATGEAPTSTIFETKDNNTVLSTTQELLREQDSLDFEDCIDDPFFADVQREIEKERKNRRAKINMDSITTDVLSTGEVFVKEDEPIVEIYPGDLYPRSTCPEKWRRQASSMQPPVSEPDPVDTEYDEVVVLEEATFGSADFAEADHDEDALAFVEKTNTTDDSTTTGVPVKSKPNQAPAPPLNVGNDNEEINDDSQSSDSESGTTTSSSSDESGSDDEGSGDDDDESDDDEEEEDDDN